MWQHLMQLHSTYQAESGATVRHQHGTKQHTLATATESYHHGTMHDTEELQA